MSILFTIPIIAGLGYTAIIAAKAYESADTARRFNLKARQWIGQHMVKISVVGCIGAVWAGNL